MLVFDTNILLENQGSLYQSPPLDYNYMSARVGFRLKTLLKSVGWIHQASGDGLAAVSTTPGNGNDVLTHETSGANGFNISAWFVLQHPGSARQLCFQSADPLLPQWRLKYSFSAGFTGGAPDPVTTPSATDEQFILGGGADASPTYSNWLTYGGDLHGLYCHMAADDAAPYGFWLAGYPVHGDDYGSYPQFVGVFDPVINTSIQDSDPYVFYFSKNYYGTPLEDDLYQFYDVNNPAVHAFLGHGGPNEMWVPLAGVRIPPFIGTGPFSPINNKIDRYPVNYMLHANWSTDGSLPQGKRPSGFKGQSTLLHWCSQEFLGGQTLQVTTPRDAIVFGWLTLPWNGTLPRV